MAIDPSALAARGLSETDPHALDVALRAALGTMAPLARRDSTDGLTREEQAVLRDGGLVLEPVAGEDPLTRSATTFAALIASALSTKQARSLRGRSRAAPMMGDNTGHEHQLRPVRP